MGRPDYQEPDVAFWAFCCECNGETVKGGSFVPFNLFE